MPLLREGALKNGRSGIFADIASLQRDGFATDTKVIAVGDDCRTTSPILAHSLVLAATSPALANLLLSTSGNTLDGFTIVLTGVHRDEVESEIREMYAGQPNTDSFVHWGLSTKATQKVCPVKRDLFKEEDRWSDDEKDVDKFWAQDYVNMDKEDKDANAEDPECEPDSEKQIELEVKCTERNCEKAFASELSLRRHLIRKHNQNPSSLTVNGQVIPILEGNRMVCPYCWKEFADKPKIRCHIATHHTNCACEHCGKTFKSTKVLKVHIERKHSSKKFFCDQCEYSTAMPKELTNHIESKHGNGINVCEACGKSYSHKAALLQHMTIKHNGDWGNKKFVCAECGKGYTQKATLAMHVKEKHSGEATLLMCDQCDFTCTAYYENSMKIHKENKHGSAKFICAFCSLVTSSSSELEIHKEEKHQNEKVQLTPEKSTAIRRKQREALVDYICHICNVQKNSRQSLKCHINREHENIKFYCTEEDCEVSKSTKRELQNHIDSFHRGIKYKCDQCHVMTNNEGNLRKHMVTKHGAQLFACDKCPMRCWSSEKMKCHMLIHE